MNKNNTNNNNEKISPYNPTSDEVILKILQLMDLIDDDVYNTTTKNTNDILFDLGCGDGRLLQKAIQINSTIICIGIDIDDIYIQRGLTTIHTNTLLEQQHINRIQLRTESIFTSTVTTDTTDTTDSTDSTGSNSHMPINDNDTELATINFKANNNNNYNNYNNNKNLNQLTLLNDATCVYIFLLPKAIVQVKILLDTVIEYRRQQYKNNSNNNSKYNNQLEQQQSSAVTADSSSKKQNYFFQVATYMFQIHGWIPTIIDRSCKANAPIYIYRFYHDDE